MKCYICGQEMTERVGDHHFTESLADRVYLMGTVIFDCPAGHGDVVRIPVSPAVTRDIAQWLINLKSRLTGRELMFLRKAMMLPEIKLASIMGTDPRTVSLWENELDGIAPENDRLLRLLCASHLGLDCKKVIEDVFPAIAGEVTDERLELKFDDYISRDEAS